MAKISLLIAAIVAITLVDIAMGILYVPADEWANYKTKFNKDYSNYPFSETYAQYYYAYNKKMIDKHNSLFDRGLRTYRLGINQFSDMRFIHFNALFPLAESSEISHDTAPQVVNDAPEPYDPIKIFGLKTTVEDQGTKCNSGWAYAVAKSIEIQKSMQTPQLTSPILSAQNLIDCAGRSKACKSQVPQAAFDYLTEYEMDLLFERYYKNNKEQDQPGMCTPPPAGQPVAAVNVITYSRIPNGDDETLKKYVSNGFPVVVEYNPTSFEFMHYAGGIFQQPTSRKGSHFMVVIGYDEDKVIDKNGMKYWLLQNSFGTTWGEGGYIRIQRTPNVKIAQNTIFASEIA